MSNLDLISLFRKFRDQILSQKLQRDVASAIKQCLEEVKERLTYWEKCNIASAGRALVWNLRSKRSSTDAWLRFAQANPPLMRSVMPKSTKRSIGNEWK